MLDIFGCRHLDISQVSSCPCWQAWDQDMVGYRDVGNCVESYTVSDTKGHSP
jgi:hypothetical protein